MALITRKKLSFGISITGSGTTLSNRIVQCTRTAPTGVTPDYTSDRFGGVLQDYPALGSASPSEEKRRNDVAAWFQPTSVPTGLAFTSRIVFIGAASAQTPSSTFGGVLAGQSPIFTRHFGVLLQIGKIATAATTWSMTGILYVQRQHSIEI